MTRATARPASVTSRVTCSLGDQPLTGVDFLKRLMTPIPPSSVLFMLQSGYSADRIMPIILDSVNGLVSGSSRLRRPADSKFTRLVRLVSEGQLAGTIEARIECPREGRESSVIVFPPRDDPTAIARRQEITSLLSLKPDLTNSKCTMVRIPGKTMKSI
jgi:hypothetical protein